MLKEFFIFIKKQASASLFGALILFFLVISKYIEIPGILRYDLLFIIAVIIQIILILTRFEHPKEVLVIIIFHITAMIMEIFKTSPEVGAWAYPEPAFFAIAAVPLFTGFMYSSVGSYIARSWRINNFRFENLPSRGVLAAIGILIYANFFTNHYVYDIRYIIFGLLIIIFWKTKFYSTLTDKRTFQIHPLITTGFMALFVWLAEQVGTFARAWIYPHQATGWHPVAFHMFTSWYLLIIFSFVIISLIYEREGIPLSWKLKNEEDEFIASILEAEQEIKDGKGLVGDLDELEKRFD